MRRPGSRCGKRSSPPGSSSIPPEKSPQPELSPPAVPSPPASPYRPLPPPAALFLSAGPVPLPSPSGPKRLYPGCCLSRYSVPGRHLLHRLHRCRDPQLCLPSQHSHPAALRNPDHALYPDPAESPVSSPGFLPDRSPPCFPYCPDSPPQLFGRSPPPLSARLPSYPSLRYQRLSHLFFLETDRRSLLRGCLQFHRSELHPCLRHRLHFQPGRFPSSLSSLRYLCRPPGFPPGLRPQLSAQRHIPAQYTKRSRFPLTAPQKRSPSAPSQIASGTCSFFLMFFSEFCSFSKSHLRRA